MNPLTNVRNLNKINDKEIKDGRVGAKSSWHNQFRDSAWIFFAGMPYELTEGDMIVVFSQYGEVVNVNLIRDRKTGKSRGFGFLCYENQLSTDLAVDNFNGAKVIGRIIRVDHVNNYRPPKDHDDADEISRMLREKGCYNVDLTEITNSNPSASATSHTESSNNRREPELVKVKEEPPSVRTNYRKRSSTPERPKHRSSDSGRHKKRSKSRSRSRERRKDDRKHKHRDRSREYRHSDERRRRSRS